MLPIPSCTRLFLLLIIPPNFMHYYDNFVNLMFYAIVLVYKLCHNFISHTFPVGHLDRMINKFQFFPMKT